VHSDERSSTASLLRIAYSHRTIVFQYLLNGESN
jgi:hypothetical protein